MENIVLDAAAFMAFLDLLNQPPKEKPASRELVTTPSVFERKHSPVTCSTPEGSQRKIYNMKKLIVDTAAFVALLDVLKQPPKYAPVSKQHVTGRRRF